MVHSNYLFILLSSSGIQTCHFWYMNVISHTISQQFNSNISFQKWCPSFSGKSTKHTVKSAHKDYFVGGKKCHWKLFPVKSYRLFRVRWMLFQETCIDDILKCNFLMLWASKRKFNSPFTLLWIQTSLSVLYFLCVYSPYTHFIYFAWFYSLCINKVNKTLCVVKKDALLIKCIIIINT